jgi:hypothetical protein
MHNDGFTYCAECGRVLRSCFFCRPCGRAFCSPECHSQHRVKQHRGSVAEPEAEHSDTESRK